MNSILIKDTTRAERERIVEESLGFTGDCEGACGACSMYDDYINGLKELSEINAAFRPHYVADVADLDRMGCPGAPIPAADDLW